MLDFSPLLTMSLGQLPGIEILNNFARLRALHLRCIRFLSAAGNFSIHFMVRSNHVISLFAGSPPTSTTQPVLTGL